MKAVFLILICFLPVTTWACPGCYDLVNGNNVKSPPYTFIILGTFILLSYIPFYILFKAATKYDPKKSDGNK